ncbi:MAG: hypothetical protein CMM91_08440 [Rickettsiales bacterium]|nr:hypothetical protein [Rickettsiales bacterium]|tara:strand:- start:16887 stop:17480 length:594 start_codon:yes stop_codon:yes gene_type:complete
MRVFLVLLISLFSTNSFAGYKQAIDFYNKKQFRQSIVEFKKVAKNDKFDQDERNNSMYNLAVIYDNGLGIPTNKNEALKWYKLASENNHKIAQFNLGWIYYHGENTEKNNFEAFKFYKKSALQGYSKAQFNLGILYFLGEGTLKDYVEAYKWFKISSLNGVKESLNFIQKVKPLLHQEELVKSEELVKNWVEERHTK